MSPGLLLAALFAVQASAAAPATPPSAAAPAPPAPPSYSTDWPPFTLFSSDDYPAAAIRGDHEGRVAFHLEIGPDGRVSNCTIRSSSGSAALDAGTCRIVRSRARFVPARDSQGNAVPDSRDGEVTWRLPPD